MTHFFKHSTRRTEAPSHFGIGLLSLGGGCFLSGRNVEVIFDVCNSGRRPCRAFRFFLFSPRTDLAPQPHRIALDLKKNPARGGVFRGVLIKISRNRPGERDHAILHSNRDIARGDPRFRIELCENTSADRLIRDSSCTRERRHSYFSTCRSLVTEKTPGTALARR